MRMSVGRKSLYAAAVRVASGLTCVLLLGGCATTAPAPSSSSASSSSPPPAPSSAASSSAAPPPATASNPAATDAWRARAASPDCRRDLASLGAGALDSFHGLPRCGRVDAEGTLGDSGAAPSQFEKLGEYRVFTSGGRSVLVYFLADDIRVVELLYPTLPRPLQAQLGAPERKIPSELSPAWEQWIYATRGLTAHVQRSNGKVAALFAYAREQHRRLRGQ